MNGTIYINNLIKTLAKKHFVAVLVLLAYLFQGAASLIYQVSWEQATEVIVGMALPTMAIVVSLFFLGMAFGAYIVRRIRLNVQYAGLVYVMNSLLLTLAGIAFVASHEWQFLCSLNTSEANCSLAIYIFRMLLVCLFLFLPAALIGASFPLLLCSLSIRQLTNGALLLYFFNVVGAMIGAILAGFVVLPYFGIDKCAIFAACLSLLSGVIVLAVNKRAFAGAESLSLESNEKLVLERNVLADSSVSCYANSFISLVLIVSASFFNMLLELLFVRLYALFMASSGFAFALVAAMQLLAIASGTFIVNFVYKVKEKNPFSIFVFVYFTAALWLLFDLVVLEQVEGIINCSRLFLQSEMHWRPEIASFTASTGLLFLNMFVPCCCLGAVLPLYFQLRQRDKSLAPLTVSSAYVANLFAAVGGTLTGGILIIPGLSKISNHAICLAFVLSLLSIALVGLCIRFRLERNKSIRHKGLVYLFGCLFFVFLIPGLSPFWQRPLISQNDDILFYREGVNATVSLTKVPSENIVLLQTDGCAEGSVQADKSLPAPNSDEQTQALLGLLPNILCTANKVFLLGLGNGTTARAILANPAVKNLTIAELEPAVVDAQQQLAPLSDSRMNIKIADGRQILSLLNSQYDVIISQAGEPWRSSSRHLYTLEFWRLVQSRLKVNGIFCQWLPLYGIDQNNLHVLCKTFTTVFPNTYVIRPKQAGEIILLACNNNLPLYSATSAVRCDDFADKQAIIRSHLPAMRRALVRIGYDDYSQLLESVSMNPVQFNNWVRSYNDKYYDGTILNCDAFPIVQYNSQALVLKRGASIAIDINKMLYPGVQRKHLIGLAEEQSFAGSGDALNMSALLSEAKGLILINNLEAAAKCLEQLLKCQPNNFEARFILGKILCHLGQSSKGLAQIKWASKIEPDNAEPNLFVTAFFISNNDWAMAQTNLEMLKKKISNQAQIAYLINSIVSKRPLDKKEARDAGLLIRGQNPI